jgi:hypothetical protein
MQDFTAGAIAVHAVTKHPSEEVVLLAEVDVIDELVGVEAIDELVRVEMTEELIEEKVVVAVAVAVTVLTQAHAL